VFSLGKGVWAGTEAGGGHEQVEGVVGSVVVAIVAEVVEAGLGAWEVGPVVAGEGRAQVFPHGGAGFVFADMLGDEEAGVVVEKGEGVAAPGAGKGEVAFEVHLPEEIWLGPLEAAAGFVFLGVERVDAAVAFENAGKGGDAGQAAGAFVHESAVEFAGAVARMKGAFGKHELPGLGIGAAGWRLCGFWGGATGRRTP
jgi:hypothetical protein